MKKRNTHILLAGLIGFMLIGCQTSNDIPTPTAQTQQMEIKPLVITPTQQGFDIHHSLGIAHVIKSPNRVVIFDYGALDSFRALGLSKNVVGVPSNIPDYLKGFAHVSNVGGIMSPDFDSLRGLKPNLILISGRQSKHYDTLNTIAPTVFVGTDSKDLWASFSNKTLSLATLYGKDKEAQQQLDRLRKNIEEKKSSLDASKKALLILTNNNSVSVYGQHSRFGIIYDVFGIQPADVNLKPDSRNVGSLEYIAKIKPDYLFVIDRDVIVKNQQTVQQLFAELIMATTKQKIIYLDPQIWYLSGGGLESMQLMADSVFQAIQ